MKEGCKVRFLNEKGKGVITKKISEYKVLVENEEGFEVEYFIKNLVEDKPSKDYKLYTIENDINLREKYSDYNKQHKNYNYKKTNKIEIQNEIEIDLHIEELIDSHKGMSNSEILNIQTIYFRKELNNAIAKKIKKLIVIHGVGEGVLKKEIRKILNKNYPKIKYNDAQYRKYGYGATEIHV